MAKKAQNPRWCAWSEDYGEQGIGICHRTEQTHVGSEHNQKFYCSEHYLRAAGLQDDRPRPFNYHAMSKASDTSTGAAPQPATPKTKNRWVEYARKRRTSMAAKTERT